MRHGSLMDQNGIARNLEGTNEAETLYVAVPGGSIDAKSGDDVIYGSSLEIRYMQVMVMTR